MTEVVKPYSAEGSKKEQVAGMFNNIAERYDFLNHFLSMNIDKLWRKKLIKLISKSNPKTILDVATGTGDLAIAALKCNPDVVQGIDISEGMLEVGKQKITAKGLGHKIKLQQADAENIPFETNEFNAITVAFGVRNFENLQKGLQEMHRVLSPGGLCAVLEFTMPTAFPIKQLYAFYFRFILPVLGKMVSNDNAAYTYLPQSVNAFPQYNAFVHELWKAGFKECEYKKLSFGIACIYLAKK